MQGGGTITSAGPSGRGTNKTDASYELLADAPDRFGVTAGLCINCPVARSSREVKCIYLFGTCILFARKQCLILLEIRTYLREQRLHMAQRPDLPI